MTFRSVFVSRPSSPAQPARPSLMLFFLLAGAFLLTLVPHVVQFPVWLTVTIVLAMAVRSILEVYRLPLPSATFCGIVAILLLGAIFWQYKGIAGREPGTAFTAGLLAIKFYELRRPRDVSLIIFSCFFVVMSALLYSQVLELFIYCLIMMWILTALLIRVHAGDQPSDHLLPLLRGAGLIFLQALPFALLLYFFFPRYTGRLGLPFEETPIGLTATVAPGSIAKLSQDDSEAMYVLFTSPNIPTIDTMYWRALALWDYHNGVWTAGDVATLPVRGKLETKPRPGEITQDITVLPHHQRWLFALDAPVSIPIDTAENLTWATAFNDHVVQLTSGRLDYTARYSVISSTAPEEEEITPDEQTNGIELPSTPSDHIDPRVIAKADELHRGLTDGQEWPYIAAVLRYFRHGGFSYSTSPGAQGPDWLPVFLFQTPTGFCEDFASAFAVLMRLEHIPARLVVGYLGADFNPYNDHYIVSQSNAHAWDEVWIPTPGQPPGGRMGRWVRIDPTALLASAEPGMPAADAGSASDPLALQIAHRPSSFSETFLPVWMREGMKELQLRREQVEADWDNFVFSYDPETQNRWAEALGLGRQAQVLLFLVCLVGMGICVIVFQKWIKRKAPLPPVELLYAMFCRKMAQRGIPRAAWEGPLAYTERVAEAFPDDKLAIRQVGSIVSQARYGAAPADTAAPHELQSLLNMITASQAASSSRDRN